VPSFPLVKASVETVRRARVEDAAAIVRLGRKVDPNLLTTEEMFRRLLTEQSRPTTERLVAEVDGTVVAWSPSGLYESGIGWLGILVLPAYRRRGIGSRIYEKIESRLRGLGATRLETAASDDDGRRFLLARGFAVTNVMRCSGLDPSTVEPVEAPVGVDVVPLRNLLDRAEELYHLYAETRADIPSQEARTPWTYEEWRTQTFELPLLDHDASVVVLEAGEPVSFAWLLSDREGARAETLMAGTRRDRRGRGLATLAKVESSRRAAALGIRRILTSNDRENEPMLAINRRLGFRESGTLETYAKRLS
jgi:GNAT superfamily N-acetyltransferase